MRLWFRSRATATHFVWHVCGRAAWFGSRDTCYTLTIESSHDSETALKKHGDIR